MLSLRVGSRAVGLAGVVGSMLSGGPANAATIQCGDVLGPVGAYTLTADLDCSSVPPEVALTLRDGATLDMDGHRLLLGPEVGVGVCLEGEGTRLRNGVIQGSEFGVDVMGIGRHHVQGIRVLSEGTRGILVSSAHNRLVSNETRAQLEGFFIAGNENWLIGNRADASDVGFGISGQGNTLIQNHTEMGLTGVLATGDRNRVIGNTIGTMRDFGVLVSGDHNQVMGNTVSTQGDIGIAVFGGVDNLIWRNVAVDNPLLDAFDDHGDCTHNRWVNNTFTKVDPTCIE